MTATRPDSRQLGQMRTWRITPNYLAHAEGSVLIETLLVLLLANAIVWLVVAMG